MEQFIKKKIPFIIVVSIMIIIITTALVHVLFSAQVEERMTAMEGLHIADEVAKEWNSTAILIAVCDIDWNVDENGRSDGWRFIYSDDPLEIINSTGFIVKVYPDNTYTTEILLGPLPLSREIDGWAIDSNEVLEIAWAHPDFIEFKEECGVGKISMGIHHPSEGKTEWGIFILEDKSLCPDEYSFRIDAETGEILKASGCQPV